jgi:hypothetical protein
LLTFHGLGGGLRCGWGLCVRNSLLRLGHIVVGDGVVNQIEVLNGQRLAGILEGEVVQDALNLTLSGYIQAEAQAALLGLHTHMIRPARCILLPIYIAASLSTLPGVEICGGAIYEWLYNKSVCTAFGWCPSNS